MSKMIQLLRTGPVIVGEFRGGKAETFRRFDKTDKNAPPIALGMYKFNIEQLADGAPVLVAVFLDNGISAEDEHFILRRNRTRRQSPTCYSSLHLRHDASEHELGSIERPITLKILLNSGVLLSR